MHTTILIPARYASSRYPGKPLAILRGRDGAKTLIQRSWEAAIQAGNDLMAEGLCDQVSILVATDDVRIAQAVSEFGGRSVMTPTSARNGTERCAAALDHIEPTDVVVNLQGDAPLTPPEFVRACVEALLRGKAVMATPALRCSAQTLAMLRSDRSEGRVGGTTVVVGAQTQALYFSKEVLPYVPPSYPEDRLIPVFHHVGVYAYRPEALRAYAALPEGPLERLEGLEQLRFLENGMLVAAAPVTSDTHEFWELNNPIDIPRIERILA